ncbi:RNA polymerase sigma factor [Nocardia sp. NPDC059240]|uniref:RNA polymerase sigma factor n=1 Tax=Nocardia sp. NPDC059240 TaxID=3346786 RepID=UPI003679442E
MSDTAEFEQYIRENLPKMTGYALRLCRSNAPLAEELVHQATIKVWKRWKEEGLKARRHVYPALDSVFVDYVRDQKRKNETLTVDFEFLDRKSDVDYVCDVVEEVRKAIRELPIRFRQVVFLTYYMGLKPALVAKDLGKTPAWVSRTLYDAHVLLREKLKDVT